jgi:hypothetical protein
MPLSPPQSVVNTSNEENVGEVRLWVAAALPKFRYETSFKPPEQFKISSKTMPAAKSLQATWEGEGKGEGKGGKAPQANMTEEPEVWDDIELNSEDEREYDMAGDEDLDGEPEVLDTKAVLKEQKDEAMERRRRMFPPGFEDR